MRRIKPLALSSSLLLLTACGGSDSSSDPAITYTGTGSAGSLAAMTVADGQLYVLNGEELVSFQLEMPTTPTQVSNTLVFGAETLFNYQDQYLFAGTQVGVEILALPTTEQKQSEQYDLTWVSNFAHIRAYDPVIAFDGQAFFTTRDGDPDTISDGDHLSALDIGDLTAPSLLADYTELNEPIGLAYLDGDVFVCDKVEGLTLFGLQQNDAQLEGELSMQLVRQPLNDFFPCIDVIADEKALILTSEQGVTQLAFVDGELQSLSQLGLR